MFSDQEAANRLIAVLRKVAQQKEGKRMNARDLMYWLQGEFEMTGVKGLTESKVKMIQEHVQLAINEEVRLDRLKEIQIETENLKIKATLQSLGGYQVSHNQHQYGPPSGC
jgi:hypothetical protein